MKNPRNWADSVDTNNLIYYKAWHWKNGVAKTAKEVKGKVQN